VCAIDPLELDTTLLNRAEERVKLDFEVLRLSGPVMEYVQGIWITTVLTEALPYAPCRQRIFILNARLDQWVRKLDACELCYSLDKPSQWLPRSLRTLLSICSP
jgi:hypothetical protein